MLLVNTIIAHRSFILLHHMRKAQNMTSNQVLSDVKGRSRKITADFNKIVGGVWSVFVALSLFNELTYCME
jgi:hypothetical protein